MTAVNKAPDLRRKKPINWCRTAFIIFGITLPWLFWLVFYVYTNFNGFLMAFQDGKGGWTLDNFKRAIESFSGGDETGELKLALKNTLITWTIGFVRMPFQVLVPYFLYKKIPLAGVYRVLFFIPAMVFGMAVTMVFTQFVSVNGFLAKQIGEWMGLNYVPELLADSRFANYTVWAHMLWIGFPGDLIIWGGTFARIPTEVLESGQLDGVNWLQEFTLITIPLVWPTFALKMLLSVCGILGASGAVFLLTNGDFGTMTLSVWMYKVSLSNVGNPESAAFNYMSAVGMLMTIVSVSLTFVVKRFTNRAFSGVDY